MLGASQSKIIAQEDLGAVVDFSQGKDVHLSICTCSASGPAQDRALASRV